VQPRLAQVTETATTRLPVWASARRGSRRWCSCLPRPSSSSRQYPEAPRPRDEQQVRAERAIGLRRCPIRRRDGHQLRSVPLPPAGHLGNHADDRSTERCLEVAPAVDLVVQRSRRRASPTPRARPRSTARAPLTMCLGLAGWSAGRRAPRLRRCARLRWRRSEDRLAPPEPYEPSDERVPLGGELCELGGVSGVPDPDLEQGEAPLRRLDPLPYRPDLGPELLLGARAAGREVRIAKAAASVCAAAGSGLSSRPPGSLCRLPPRHPGTRGVAPETWCSRGLANDRGDRVGVHERALRLQVDRDQTMRARAERAYEHASFAPVDRRLQEREAQDQRDVRHVITMIDHLRRRRTARDSRRSES